MFACSRCGTLLADDLRFCTQCGNPSPAQTTQYTAPTVTWQHQGAADISQSPTRTSSSRTALIIVATVVGTLSLLGLGALGFLALRSTGDEPSEKPRQTSGVKEGPAASPPFSVQTPSPAILAPTIPKPDQPAPLTRNLSVAENQAVIEALEGWAAAVRAHDLDSHMDYYAETLHTYYLKHNVTSAYVRSSLQPAYARYPRMEVSLRNIAVNLNTSGDEATVTLVKTYSFEGDKTMSGSVREMLWLSKSTGRWLITGIRDLQEYYKSR